MRRTPSTRPSPSLTHTNLFSFRNQGLYHHTMVPFPNSTSSSQSHVPSHAPAREERPMQLDSGIPREPGMEGGRVVSKQAADPNTPQHPFLRPKTQDTGKRTSQPTTHRIRSAQRFQNAAHANTTAAAENRTLGNKSSKCYERASVRQLKFERLTRTAPKSDLRAAFPAPSPCRLHRPMKLLLSAKQHVSFFFFPSSSGSGMLRVLQNRSRRVGMDRLDATRPAAAR